MRTLIKNIGCLVTPEGTTAQKGQAQGQVRTREKVWLLMEKGRIAQIGQQAETMPQAEQLVDAKGKLVTPGLVDPHTHLVFGGWREKELAMKLKQIPYLDILAQGGGILSTVQATRAATKDELKAKAKKILHSMLRQGVTTVEAKSGYGLDVATEIKMLEVVQELQQEEKIAIVSTFMGAHAVPPEFKQKREAYIDLVVQEMLPKIVELKLAQFIDVFCEEGVFSVEESQRVLQAGKEWGLGVKCHSDEIVPLGGTELAARLGAISCEHLIHSDDKGIAALADGGTIACLLPATSFYLNADYAPAGKMLAAGVPIAFGSDFNPGSCPCDSLQLAMHIGCYKYAMTPAECLTAVTLNSAAAVGRAEDIGTIEEGKAGDLVIWDAPDLDYLFYRLGGNLAEVIVKNGEVVEKND